MQRIGNTGRIRPLFILLFICSLSLALMPLATLVAGEITISSASYKAGKKKLIVKGKGPKRTSVQLRDASTQAVIASTITNKKGKWTIKHKIATPPCNIVASADGYIDQQAVKGTSKFCTSTPATAAEPIPDSQSYPVASYRSDSQDSAASEATAPLQQAPTSSSSSSGSLRIEKAKWESGDRILVVKGETARRTSVTVKDADSDKTLKQTVSKYSGEWKIKKRLSSPPCRVKVLSDGHYAERAVAETGRDCSSPPGGDGGTPAGDYVTLAINDLGMHCADLDYQVFSILPPYNVIHGQVIRKGRTPRLMSADEVDLYYTAARSPADTIPADTITTTSQNIEGLFKSNFWDANQTGRIAYDPLYPEGVLDLFDLSGDKGLPAPNVERLHLGDGQLEAHQQAMPGIAAPGAANDPQQFHAYIGDFPFFKDLPFGYVAEGLHRHAAEGVPILPAADPEGSGQVQEAPYPLMQVTAVSQGGNPANADNQLASVRTVLPVASEADCQLCHADADVCSHSSITAGQDCNGKAASFAGTDFDVISADELAQVPGDTAAQVVVNAAKINILRLHDAKHGTELDAQRNVVCATCHYSPALDLAQLGPNNDNGKQQLNHVSMSRAMHQHHGDFTELFPDMPEPGNRDDALVKQVLDNTCYACHPGKRTQCLRGAMTRSGIVCQDCHGNMQQVGNDFSADMPNFDWDLRVPWASEPGCQSCHTGDATDNLAQMPGVIVADDGIRLLQAFKSGDPAAKPIVASNRRFAETRDAAGNDHLYRLSKGHGGVMCEGCHGSTHAIWPNPWPASNDNLTATDLQGHAGTLTECSVCHADSNLGLTLKGPHGMHPVGSRYWNEYHKEISEKQSAECKSCHGENGQGTVLSRTATQRQWICKDKEGTLCDREDQVISVPKGTTVNCKQCHKNEIDHR